MSPSDYKTLEHPRMLFFLSFFGFTIGISCGVLSNVILGIELTLLFACLLLLLGWWKHWYIVILIIAISLGGWYMWHADFVSRELSYNILLQETNSFSGKYTIRWKVENILYTNNLSSTYRLKIDSIANTSPLNSGSLAEENVGIFLEVPNNLHINSGDIIEYQWKITKVIDTSLSGFAGYAWYHRVYWKSSVPLFSRIHKNDPGYVEQLQHWAKAVLFRGFPEDIAGIILGMTIGNIELLTTETKKSFTNAGITHILVVSGSNIAFVIIILSGILRYIPIRRVIQSSIVILFVILYGTLVWWDTPVIRAVAMWLITYMALEWGKRASSIAILFLVWWGILLSSPLALIYDAGFGLSFAGTLGILLFHKYIWSRIKHQYIPKFVVDIISVTIAASIGSMVAIIYHFGTIPLNTIFSNILISGVLGWVLFSSVLYLLFALIWWWLIYIWWWTIYLPTAYIMWIGNFFGNGYTLTLDENIAHPLALCLIGSMMTLVFFIERVKS